MHLKAFSYSAVLKLKLDEPRVNVLQDKLVNISDLYVKSREFSNYMECVHSCKKLMDDFVGSTGPDAAKFRVGSEINPLFSGEASISKDWMPGEVARLWAIEKESEGSERINAIAKAKIFGKLEPTVTLLAN